MNTTRFSKQDLLCLCLPVLLTAIVLGAVLGYRHTHPLPPQETTPEVPSTVATTTAVPTTTQPATVPLSKINTDFYHGKVIGQIDCDSLDIHAPLVYGTTDSDLMKGAGLHEFSSLPGFVTPPLIAGHARIDFTGFANAVVGDEITVTMDYGTYGYKIADIRIMDKSAFSFRSLTEETDQCIFYACYPFYKTNYTKNERIFFYCDRISGPEVVDDIHHSGTSRRAVTPKQGNGYLSKVKY